MTQTKYKASKVEYDNHKFDSKLECNIYKTLQEKYPQIKVELQPKYLLQEKFFFKGKTIREINYIGDFLIVLPNQEVYVVDAKGMETPVFKLKRKMFMLKYGSDIVTIKSVKQFISWMDGVLNA